MIEIDGSRGEGGGQIVRTAVALSAVTRTPVRISNIRAGRPKPGLSHQHVKAIEALALISGFDIEGVRPGSDLITFRPAEVKGGGDYQIDIGTAGSISLLMQCLLPALVHADGAVSLEVRGGTDVNWSPTIDYLQEVALPAFGRFGVRSRLVCIRRGYYPRGGGRAVLEVEPSRLRRADIKIQEPGKVQGVSHCSNLPEHVARRQAESAVQTLINAGRETFVETALEKAPSTGSGITLWSGYKGSSALGARGIRAESVGRLAAEDMLAEIESKAAVDIHLADQLVPYLALAGGSYTTRSVSRHTRTNIETASRFLDVEIYVTKDDTFTDVFTIGADL
ncbi:MAG: RNA 3'-terminal phosphate cyclase [Methanotrichaceae archaeon]